MGTFFGILIGTAVLVFIVWGNMPSPRRGRSEEPRDGELIDPEDARQVGWLIGMTGGTIADAAVARYALERFERIHGRKATTNDVGVVVGLMRGGSALTGGEDSKN